jgi:PilZ domain
LASEPVCPRCSHRYVKRVSRIGVGELLLSLFRIYPFRCQLCARRFKVLQWGITYTRIEEVRREYQRLRAKIPITLTVRGGNVAGSTVDLSMGGCSFDTEIQLVKGTIFGMELRLPDQIPPVKVQAAVIRSIRLGRASAEFLRIERGERERLQGFVRSLMLSP